jgi:hypothetical protein
MSTDAGKRETGNTLATSAERGISREGVVIDEFIRLLKGSVANPASAPSSLTLPQSLYAALKEAARKAYEDGHEHGGIFGYFQDGGAIKFGIQYAEGDELQIDFSKMRKWPTLSILGRFHTHLHQQSDQGSGWAGGGHSGDDIANFYYRDERALIIYAQTKFPKWKIYCLLKPQEYSMPGTPKNIRDEYDARVKALVGKGLDPIDATQKELTRLAKGGAFVFYASEDSPLLARQG